MDISFLPAASPTPVEIEDTAAPVKDEVANRPACVHILREMITQPATIYKSYVDFQRVLTAISRKYKHIPSKRELGIVYRELRESNPSEFPNIYALRTMLIRKAVRSDSGILNISVSMPPDKFSCKYNCHFCPNEPGMPRSYLSNEDVFVRAARVDFDTVRQVHDRLDVLEKNGHPIDKLEFRVLGGTFSCYDHAIADTFVRDLYYAANIYYADDPNETVRERGTIEEEQARNVTAKVHVVGLGVETRPDEINDAEIVRFRRYGVTRVELGVQHTDDALLRKVNRGHLVKHSRAAIKLLKDYGFKVEIHIMTDLPGATPEGDMECYRQVLRDDPDLIPDYMKDYPCLDVDFTQVKKWKADGRWQPYAERTPDARELVDVLVYRQSITPRWVRVNRIQRDFKPAHEDSLGFTSETLCSNLAQVVKTVAESRGVYCQCIRCSEVRGESFDPSQIRYDVHSFTASGGKEFFIEAVVPRPHRNLILGFIRLRLSDALRTSILPELVGNTAMIRELHVYGRVTEVGSSSGADTAQHLGLGKKLLEIAETLATRHGATQMAIISGIGVRDYYRKRGYTLRGSYMMKRLETDDNGYCMGIVITAVLAVVLQGLCVMLRG